MHDWWAFAIFAAVVFFGTRITNRISMLPKPDRDPVFTDALADAWITIEIDNLMESNFSVEYTDGWSVGRSFWVYGKPVLSENWPSEVRPSERVGAEISPALDSFSSSRLGYLRTYEKGGCSLHITLPFQIARHALEDLRRESGLRASFDIKREERDGQISYGVFGFDILSD